MLTDIQTSDYWESESERLAFLLAGSFVIEGEFKSYVSHLEAWSDKIMLPSHASLPYM